MSQSTDGSGMAQNSPIFRAVADGQRRQILAILADRVTPVEIEELAIQLVAAEQDTSLLDVTDEEAEKRRATLRHIHLPALADAGLVTWDEKAGTVTTTDHPALEDPKLSHILETEAANWDAVIDSLADKHRRIVLSVLTDHDGAMSPEDLAADVATRLDDTGETDSIEDIQVFLHHVHLPKLAQAGLVEYDASTGEVTYEGHPELDDEWVNFRDDETPRAILPTAHHSDDIWTIEGRDNVIARGQSLFEQADDELFLMFTTTGLLEDGCLRRLQDAVDRGVDVYLGSQTQEVRDLVRERVPGATIWEPQMDWLNLPPEHEKVGRLVFADREAIMLATLGEEPGDGVHYEETAITGFDENNPLVLLLREMLGSRLDYLDAQSEDFLSQMPL